MPLSDALAMMLVKALCIYGVARFAKSSHADALDRAVLMAQGGEFAFVLFAAALGAKVIDPVVNANMTAIVVLSMALTPLMVMVHRRLATQPAVSMEGIEAVNGQAASVLVIGFGRFGQIASQGVIARGASITIIDNNVQMIRDAEAYGFKVYYGDGCRADVLHAAGAHLASAILVCLDNKAAATRIAELAKTEFPHAQLLVRAFDREHVLELRKADVDYLVRETFESAMAMGREAVLTLGAAEEEANEVMEHLRRRDAERMDLEAAGGMFAGRALVLGNQVKKAAAHPAAQDSA
jgi:glutathione-regulated potassium-efflux system protein KefB